MMVVDASLATKWFIREEDSAAALTFLGTHQAQICAPDLLALEVARALVAAANARRITQTAARAALAAWFRRVGRDELPLHSTVPQTMARGAEIALRIGHPLPDCIYLALAIEQRCPLVTCDVKFRDKALSVYPDIEMLADLA